MKRRARGAIGVLLAALVLGACSKPQGEPGGHADPAVSHGAISGAAPSGIGLKGGLGTGLTGSFPSTSTATRAPTGAMGNSGTSGETADSSQRL